MLKYLLLFLCLNTTLVFSQSKIRISGNITNENKNVSGVVLEFHSGQLTKKVISDNNGGYKFVGLSPDTNNVIILKAYYLGLKPLIQEFKFPTKDTVIDFHFIGLENNNLKEVAVKGTRTAVTDAYKSVYKINPVDYIKNTKSDKVLATLQGVSIQDEEILVNGKNKATIFIDGIESNNKELKTISADEIEKVEVITNPSASYNSDFIGSVINVVLKKKKSDYFKGSIEGTAGVRNNFYSIFPTLAYKKKSFLIKSYYSYLHNTQTIDYNSSRENSDGTYYNQTSIRKPTGYQQVFNTKISLIISSKSKVNISNEVSGYKFNSDATGTYNSDAQPVDAIFSNNNNLEKQNRWSLSGVYSFKLNPKNIFYLKGKYFQYNNINSYNISENDTSSLLGVVKSTTNESTGEADHAYTNFKLLGKSSDLYSGIKYIDRHFDFISDQFNIGQRSESAFTELNTKFSAKLSAMMGLSFENTTNSAPNLDQHYNYLLPTVNLSYDLGSDYGLRGGYSTKIIRPSAKDLNDELIYLNPGLAEQGNRNLKPQVRNYLFVTLNKKIAVSNLSLTLFNESINHAIIPIYRIEKDVLVSTLDNAAHDQSTGFNFGFQSKLFDLISTNLNAGLDYNKFSNSSVYSIIKQNDGYTYRANCNLSSNIIHKKLALTLSGYYNSPVYTLINKTVTRPNLNFNAETNFFKDKLNISLSYNNIFAMNSRTAVYTNTDTFNQNIFTRNNTSNLTLTVAFYFGKTFSSSIANSTVDNDDIIIR
jgi:hypothetical protein